VVTVSGPGLVVSLILSPLYVVVSYGARSRIGRQTTADILACWSSSWHRTHLESEEELSH
jgi:hypothetical protein